MDLTIEGLNRLYSNPIKTSDKTCLIVSQVFKRKLSPPPLVDYEERIERCVELYSRKEMRFNDEIGFIIQKKTCYLLYCNAVKFKLSKKSFDNIKGIEVTQHSGCDFMIIISAIYVKIRCWYNGYFIVSMKRGDTTILRKTLIILQKCIYLILKLNVGFTVEHLKNNFLQHTTLRINRRRLVDDDSYKFYTLSISNRKTVHKGLHIQNKINNILTVFNVLDKSGVIQSHTFKSVRQIKREFHIIYKRLKETKIKSNFSLQYIKKTKLN